MSSKKITFKKLEPVVFPEIASIKLTPTKPTKGKPTAEVVAEMMRIADLDLFATEA